MDGDTTPVASRVGSGTHVSEESTGETAAQRGFRLFVAFWSLAALAHLTNNAGAGFEEPTGWLVAAAAIYALCSPGSLRRLALLAAVQLLDVIWLAPHWADHQLLMAAVNLSILLRVGQIVRSDGERSLEPGQEGAFFTAHASTMQVLLLIAYSAAAVAKYNQTFLEPATSCATFLTDFATGGILGRPAPQGRLHVVAAIAPESLIPLLLIAPMTRRLGVRFAVAFHFVVAASPLIAVEDFSFTLYPLFFLFLPPGDTDRLVFLARRSLLASSSASALRRIRPDSLRAAGLTLALVVVTQRYGPLWSLLFWLTGLVIGLVVLFELFRSLRRAGGPRAILTRPPAVQYVAIGVLALFAASPYLGLRTAGVFTMFSNLDTSAENNHVFIPSADPTGRLNDLVVPSSASSSHFDALAAEGAAVHYFEVQRILAENDDAVIVGTHNGSPIDSRLDSFWISEPPVLLRKLLLFRPVPVAGEPPCTN